MNAKQAKFLEKFREHKNLERAYAEAGYTGSAKSAYRLLKDLGESEIAITKADPAHVAKQIVPEVSAPGHTDEPEHYRRLRTKKGREEWLMDFISGKLEITKHQVYFDQEGNRCTDEIVSVPDFKERAKAMELLQKSAGDHTTKLDVKGSVDVTATAKPRPVYIHVDNGRGPALPVTARTTGNRKMEACACGAVYESGAPHVCPAPAVLPG